MDKKLTIALLACSLVGMPYVLTATPAHADTAPQCLRTPEMVGPVTLVQLAYQGAFEKQGIPSAAGLTTGFNQGTITPEKIVNAAVQACFLKDKYGFATNEAYLEDMKLELQGLIQGR